MQTQTFVSAAAIRKLMGARKRAWQQIEPRRYPVFADGMSTSEYVRLFNQSNSGAWVHALPYSVLSTSPQRRPSELVQVETIDASDALDAGRLAVADYFAQQAA
jgi:hypothetical protein